MFRTRAWRRHHIERLKRKRRNYWGGYASHDARSLHRVTRTPRPCSCPMCGNPRRWFGEPTVQERRAEEPIDAPGHWELIWVDEPQSTAGRSHWRNPWDVTYTGDSWDLTYPYSPPGTTINTGYDEWHNANTYTNQSPFEITRTWSGG